MRILINVRLYRPSLKVFDMEMFLYVIRYLRMYQSHFEGWKLSFFVNFGQILVSWIQIRESKQFGSGSETLHGTFYHPADPKPV
jgi:hypothetical protein